MLYQVSQSFRFHEERKSVLPDGFIELDDKAAKQYMKDHPGLLKPAMENTMAAPESVRTAPVRTRTNKKARA